MRPSLLSAGLLWLGALTAHADWIHWRGPNQNGFSTVTGLPDRWSPNPAAKESNLVWKAPYGCRSTPLILGDRLYIIQGFGSGQTEGERVVCLNADTGEFIWEKRFSVFHSDIVSNRLGWANLTSDGKKIFAHTTGGFLVALDAKDGKEVWSRQLTEEFGRFTGYGGRIGGGPLYEDGLVIVGIVNSSWGEHARGANRFFAFDADTGAVVWISEAPFQNRGTYYSNPVTATINGKRLLITGGSDGAAHAFQLRTGKLEWSYPFSVGVINGSPIVDGNLVYIAHGEENPEGGGIGRIICLDASQVVKQRPKLVWEYRKAQRFGLASPALAYGKLFIPDDSAKLYCFDAKKGKLLWRVSYGTVARGAPVVADNKIYLSETNARFHIIKLTDGGKEEPKEDDFFTHFFRNDKGPGFIEINGTPAIDRGRVYFATLDEIFCIGSKTPGTSAPYPIPEKRKGTKPAQVQIFPADVSVVPGATQKFTLKFFDADGYPTDPPANAKAEWSLPLPPPPPGSKNQPPALDAAIQSDGLTAALTSSPKKPSQQGILEVKVGDMVAKARVRVVAQIPYTQNFAPVPVGAVPGGWVNTAGKFRVVELDDNGTKVKALAKVNNDARAPIVKAIAFITAPESTNYTIQADIRAVEVRGKLPDAGLCFFRYLVYLDGKLDTSTPKRQLRLICWEGPRRIEKVVDFDWKSGVWYTLKATVVPNADGTATVKAKVWDRKQPEPTDWSLEVVDPFPNLQGSAGLYGYISNVLEDQPGSEIYYTNLRITPNR